MRNLRHCHGGSSLGSGTPAVPELIPLRWSPTPTWGSAAALAQIYPAKPIAGEAKLCYHYNMAAVHSRAKLLRTFARPPSDTCGSALPQQITDALETVASLMSLLSEFIERNV